MLYSHVQSTPSPSSSCSPYTPAAILSFLAPALPSSLPPSHPLGPPPAPSHIAPAATTTNTTITVVAAATATATTTTTSTSILTRLCQFFRPSGEIIM